METLLIPVFVVLFILGLAYWSTKKVLSEHLQEKKAILIIAASVTCSLYAPFYFFFFLNLSGITMILLLVIFVIAAIKIMQKYAMKTLTYPQVAKLYGLVTVQFLLVVLLVGAIVRGLKLVITSSIGT